MKKKCFLDERKYLLISLVITLLSSIQVGAMDVVAVPMPKKKLSKKEKEYYNEQLARALYEGQSVEVIRKLPSFEPDCFLNLKYLVKPISRNDYKDWAKRGKIINDYDMRLSFLAYFLIGWRECVTPLQLAIWQGHAHVVRFLLERGADANLLSINPYAKDKAQWFSGGHYRDHPTTYTYCFVRPLDIALLVGKAEVAQILLEHGAVSTCHPIVASMLWPEFVEYCNARGISPFKKEFRKTEIFQGFNAFFTPLVTEGSSQYENPVWFNERVLQLTLDSGIELPLTNKPFTLKEGAANFYVWRGNQRMPWLKKALMQKNEDVITLLMTHPFLVPLLPDYSKAKKRILTALMIINRYRKSLSQSHGDFPQEIFYLILRSTQATALDMLSVLTGHLFDRKTVQKQGLVTCSPAVIEALKVVLTTYKRVLPLSSVLPLLKENFIEQQRQFLVQRSLIATKKVKEHYALLQNLDLLGDGFDENYGERIMEKIRKKLCLPAPNIELHDRAEPLNVSLRSCSIGGEEFYFREPEKPESTGADPVFYGPMY